VAPQTTTFYYDPILDVHHRLPVVAALTTGLFGALEATRRREHPSAG